MAAGGTALAKMLTDNGNTIAWWLRNEEAVDYLKMRHHNPTYLSSVRFEPGLIHPYQQPAPNAFGM